MSRSTFYSTEDPKKRTTGDVDAIGSKGLGAKAPLAISDIFFIETTKDGITTNATVYKTNKGFNSADVGSTKTDKAPGTTVTIPVAIESINQIKYTILNINPIHVTAIFTDTTEGYCNQKLLGVQNLLPWTKNSKTNYKTRFDNAQKAVDDKFGKQVCVNRFSTSDNFMFIGTKVIDGASISAWLDVYEIINVNKSNTLTAPEDLKIMFNIGGWEYEQSVYASVYVDLPAGFLNFTPSRDYIKHDRQYENLCTFIREWVADEYKSIAKDHYLDLLNTLPYGESQIQLIAENKTVHMVLALSGNEIKTYGTQEAAIKKTDIEHIARPYTKALLTIATTFGDIKMVKHYDAMIIDKICKQTAYKINMEIISYHNVYIGSPDTDDPEFAEKFQKFTKGAWGSTCILTKSNDETKQIAEMLSDTKSKVTTDLKYNKFAIMCGKYTTSSAKTKKNKELSQRVYVFEKHDSTMWRHEIHTISTAARFENTCLLFTRTNESEEDASFAKIKCDAHFKTDIERVYVITMTVTDWPAISAWAHKNNIPCIAVPYLNKYLLAECGVSDKLASPLAAREINKALGITHAKQIITAYNAEKTYNKRVGRLSDCADKIKNKIRLPKDIIALTEDKLPSWFSWSMKDLLEHNTDTDIKQNVHIEAFAHATSIVHLRDHEENEHIKKLKAKAIGKLMRDYTRNKREQVDS